MFTQNTFFIAKYVLTYPANRFAPSEYRMLKTMPEEDTLIEAADFLSTVGNEKRLLILDAITRDELCVGDIAERIGLSQSALSQHLGKLRAARLAETRRDAQTIYYSCKSQEVAQFLEAIGELFVVDADRSLYPAKIDAAD